MGSFNAQLEASDVFQDVYNYFYDQYNEGVSPSNASRSVLKEYSEYLSDDDDKYDAHFALALAQWETLALEKSIVLFVQEAVQSGADLKNWKARGANEKLLQERTDVLDELIAKILSPPKEKKRRKKRKLDFSEEVLVDEEAPDSNKRFTVTEEYRDGKYIHTGALLMWSEGGGSVFYYHKQGAVVSGKWIDSENLEVEIEKDLNYTKKDDSAFYSGDEVYIHYIEK